MRLKVRSTFPIAICASRRAQRRPEAEAQPQRERKMAILPAPDVQVVWAGELCRVAVGSPDNRRQEIARCNPTANNPDLRGRTAAGRLHRRIEKRKTPPRQLR